jgi:hypothetical protein
VLLEHLVLLELVLEVQAGVEVEPVNSYSAQSGLHLLLEQLVLEVQAGVEVELLVLELVLEVQAGVEVEPEISSYSVQSGLKPLLLHQLKKDLVAHQTSHRDL